MKYLGFLIVVFLLAVSNLSVAGTELGNGGDIVVCDKGIYADSPKTELLDFYEARTMRGVIADLSEGTTAQEKAKAVLARLANFDKKLAEEYSYRVDEFVGKAVFLKNTPLPDVPDSGYIYLESGCHLVQLVIQREPKFPKDPVYVIDANHWNQADVITQAGMILHEIIYTDTLRLGHQDSVRTRYIVGELASNQFAGATVDSWNDIQHYGYGVKFKFGIPFDTTYFDSESNIAIIDTALPWTVRTFGGYVIPISSKGSAKYDRAGVVGIDSSGMVRYVRTPRFLVTDKFFVIDACGNKVKLKDHMPPDYVSKINAIFYFNSLGQMTHNNCR